MEYAVEAAFKDRPDALYRVGVCHTVDELLCGMVDYPVFEASFKPAVHAGFVGVERGSGSDGASDDGLQRGLVRGLHDERADVSAALADSEHGDFSYGSAPGAELPVRMLVVFQSSDLCLVHLHYPAEHVAVHLPSHGFAYPVHHEPCGFLRYSYLLAYLDR